MTYKLTATVTHKSFDAPLIHEFFYQGNSLDDILAQIDTLPNHIHNLKHNLKTAFKDQNGVKHSWKLEHMKSMN